MLCSGTRQKPRIISTSQANSVIKMNTSLVGDIRSGHENIISTLKVSKHVIIDRKKSHSCIFVPFVSIRFLSIFCSSGRRFESESG